MKILQFKLLSDSKIQRVGFLRKDGKVVDLKSIEPNAPNTVIEILREVPHLLGLPEAKLDYVPGIDRENIEFLPPVSGGDKVVCVGMNYKDHCEEQNCPVPTEPIFFNKFPSCLIGAFNKVEIPSTSGEVDWEVELAVVIGRQGKGICEKDAYDYVLGYTVADDVSARDYQLKKNGGQWLIGKTFDGFCPLGPVIVTKDEIPDPHVLKLKYSIKPNKFACTKACTVNGEVKQDSNTNQIVFQIPHLIATLSQHITLYPGDVILTGTPPGVGVFAKPPCFIKNGDQVECEIEKIGAIKNEFYSAS